MWLVKCWAMVPCNLFHWERILCCSESCNTFLDGSQQQRHKEESSACFRSCGRHTWILPAAEYPSSMRMASRLKKLTKGNWIPFSSGDLKLEWSMKKRTQRDSCICTIMFSRNCTESLNQTMWLNLVFVYQKSEKHIKDKETSRKLQKQRSVRFNCWKKPRLCQKEISNWVRVRESRKDWSRRFCNRPQNWIGHRQVSLCHGLWKYHTERILCTDEALSSTS